MNIQRILKSKRLFASFILCACSFVFAIPGISSSDNPKYGQYIYYRDYTFPSETYIGFAEYSDSVIAVRYYSPNAIIGSKDLSLYISLNPNSSFFDMTGERIIGNATNDDVEVLNYMHDLLYEFTARRKNVTLSKDAEITTSKQDYAQFGGNVVIEFDKYFPVFNIKSISSTNGKLLFEAVTVGSLISNSGNDVFGSIKNFPHYNKPTPIKKSSSNKDYVWIPASSNGGLFFLEDSAMLLFYMVDLRQTDLQDSSFNEWFIDSILYSGDPSSTIYLPELKIISKDDSCLLSFILFDEEGDGLQAFDIIEKSDETDMYLVYHYVIMNDFYNENKAYFTDLLKEYL